MIHTHSGDGTVPGLHGEPIPTPVLGCPACATVHSIGGELGAAPEGPEPSLADFLLARIAEDEAETGYVGEDGGGWELGSYVDSSDDFPPVLTISRARVLAECEAKRQIVEDLQQELANQHDPEPTTLQLAERTLLTLTLPYADHPDFREEWKP